MVKRTKAQGAGPPAGIVVTIDFAQMFRSVTVVVAGRLATMTRLGSGGGWLLARLQAAATAAVCSGSARAVGHASAGAVGGGLSSADNWHLLRSQLQAAAATRAVAVGLMDERAMCEPMCDVCDGSSSMGGAAGSSPTAVSGPAAACCGRGLRWGF